MKIRFRTRLVLTHLSSAIPFSALKIDLETPFLIADDNMGQKGLTLLTLLTTNALTIRLIYELCLISSWIKAYERFLSKFAVLPLKWGIIHSKITILEALSRSFANYVLYVHGAKVRSL